MKIGSLCSGYGGLDLGLQSVVGGDVAWHFEYDKHPSAILDHRFPGIPNYRDITTHDFTGLEPIDWLTAGYPCQPFSHAGKRQGANDERHLWPDVLRAVGVLRPGGVLLENVAGHVSLGLDRVLWDLATVGYDATWSVVRAADAGAPHGRARVFIVATDAGGQRHGGGQDGGPLGFLAGGDASEARERQRARPETVDRGTAAAQDADLEPRIERGIAAPGQAESGRARANAGRRGRALATDAARDGRHEGRTEPARIERGPDAPLGSRADAADADSKGPQGGEPARRFDLPAWGAYEPAILRWEHVLGRRAPRPTEPGRNGERLSPRFVEWMMGLPAGWVTDVPGLPRNAQLKALGNGVVPQQAALALRLLLPLAVAA